MRKTARVLVLVVLSLLSAVVLGVAQTTPVVSLAASVEALIMGGTGRPMPSDFPGYMENVRAYYLEPNTACVAGPSCESVSVFTPETAWPLYGGLTAPTWQESINQGVVDFDTTFRQHLADNPTAKFAFLGYSQSGAIIAFEKRALADDPSIDESQIQIVAIGNSSRPNGGINTRVPFSIPIVQFPYGPATPTDTDIETYDIGFKWDIITDAPLYLNPVAWLNALLGFEYVHGTMPDPTLASPDSTPGGYSVAQWQDMMDNPENYPDIIDIQTFGDTTYLTVTPTVMPLVQPLHSIPLLGKPIADLIEPALRVFVEQTGYNRSIPFGQPTPLQLIPIFNPVTLTVDLIAAGIQGVQNFINDLGGLTMPAAPLSTPLSTLAAPEPALSGPPKLDSDLTLKSGPPPSASQLTPPKPLTLAAPKNDDSVVKSGNMFTPGTTTPLTTQNDGTSSSSTLGTTSTTTTTTTTETGADETTTEAATPAGGDPSSTTNASQGAAA